MINYYNDVEKLNVPPTLHLDYLTKEWLKVCRILKENSYIMPSEMPCTFCPSCNHLCHFSDRIRTIILSAKKQNKQKKQTKKQTKKSPGWEWLGVGDQSAMVATQTLTEVHTIFFLMTIIRWSGDWGRNR